MNARSHQSRRDVGVSTRACTYMYTHGHMVRGGLRDDCTLKLGAKEKKRPRPRVSRRCKKTKTFT